MSKNWFRRGAAFLVYAFVVLFIISGMGLAESLDYSEYKFLDSDSVNVIDPDGDLINFKAKLYELGFYASGADDGTLRSRELDDLTMAAVKLVCDCNPDLKYYQEGVSLDLYYRVMEGELITPQTSYENISPGAVGEDVNRLQDRLGELGYAEAFEFTPKVYDSALQEAIDAFVRCNNMTYDEEGVTAELQEKIFSDTAKSYTAEDGARGVQGRIFAFLGAKTNIAGVGISNAVMLVVGFLLLCVIVFLIMNLTGTTPKKKNSGICFTVEYGGKSYVHRVNDKGCIRIGRETGEFPLNMADDRISRRHCEIYFDKKGLMLRDFSTHGTKINGEICHHARHVLHTGDVIEIGEHKITIEF